MTTFELRQHVTYNNKRWAIFEIRVRVPAEEVTL